MRPGASVALAVLLTSCGGSSPSDGGSALDASPPSDAPHERRRRRGEGYVVCRATSTGELRTLCEAFCAEHGGEDWAGGCAMLTDAG